MAARALVLLLLLLLVAKGVVRGEEDVGALRGDVRALQAQVAALLQRRSDDFRLLEDSLRGSLEKSLELSSLRGDLDALRQEVEGLRAGAEGGGGGAAATATRQHNDRATLQWAAAAVTELRAAQAQAAAARNATAEELRRHQTESALALLRKDVAALGKELGALSAQAQRDAVAAHALGQDVRQAQQRAQDASAQCADTKQQLQTAVDDWTSSMRALRSSVAALGASPHQRKHPHHLKHLKHLKHQQHQQQHQEEAAGRKEANAESNEVWGAEGAWRRTRRHEAGRRRQAEAEAAEGAAAALEQRVSALERSGSARAAALDKLHLSALQLLEGVQAVEAKVEGALPELRREVSKAEAGAAQAQAQLQLLREEQENQRASVRALAGGQAALQEKADGALARIAALQGLHHDSNNDNGNGNATDAEQQQQQQRLRLGARVASLEKRLQMIPVAAEADWASAGANNASDVSDGAVPGLVRQLARVQHEYESIVRRLPHECSEVSGPSGLYLVAPGGEGAPLVTFCQQPQAKEQGEEEENEDGEGGGGGWTLLQRRTDGALDFNRKWKDYAEGFGSPAGEFWLGLRALHRLTAANCSELLVELRDIYGGRWTARYADFRVGPEADGFRLRVAGYSGNASDALAYQDNMQFSAIDQDRDISNTHCAQNYEGGWWFSHCQHANLNGRYNLGLTWFDAAKNEWIAVAASEMKLRRRRGRQRGGQGACA